ncbi:MAG: histidine triad nucleotide-binding protein [Clostridia bacterium]|nr:histidine triad nucleotide-binding protein [Clostridia bacterium]
MNCIFCKIVNGDIPSKRVYENDKVIVINDIHPACKVHLLIISKDHIESANHLTEDNADIVKDMFMAAKEAAKLSGVSESGYRLINNCGSDGGQTINHLHIHLLGGEKLGERLL